VSLWKGLLAGFQGLIGCRYCSRIGFGNGLDSVAVKQQHADDDVLRVR